MMGEAGIQVSSKAEGRSERMMRGEVRVRATTICRYVDGRW
jgi:hypothetical protein